LIAPQATQPVPQRFFMSIWFNDNDFLLFCAPANGIYCPSRLLFAQNYFSLEFRGGFMNGMNSIAHRDIYNDDRVDVLLQENAELKSKLQDSDDEVGRLYMVLKRQVDNLAVVRRLGKNVC
jgi:hypothetical protein